eukprot:m.770029 g.770029  ORF g.770029 m.770029 type:complete len:307 (+) comp23238_c3_seq10:247-1167(+)
MGEWDQFRMPTDDTNITFGKVAFGYESKNAGELTITAGEYITILQRDDGKGWSRAVSTQKEVGYVPANYFHEISEQEFTASRQKTQPSRAPPPPPTSQSSQDSGEQVKALYSFDARDTTQVSFQKGDVLVVIENSSPDWWKVRTRTGAEGFAPSNYVTVIEGKTPQTARPVSSIVPSMNIDFSSGYASKSELEPTAEDDGPLYETIREDKRPPPARAAPKAPTAPKAPVTSTLSAPVAAAPNQVMKVNLLNWNFFLGHVRHLVASDSNGLLDSCHCILVLITLVQSIWVTDNLKPRRSMCPHFDPT